MSTSRAEQPDELRRVLQEAEKTQSTSGIGHRVIREEVARVTVNIWPQLIPRDSVDPALLIEAVRTEFGAGLDVSSLMQRVPVEARAGLSLPSLLSHALQDDDVIIKFQGGYLAIPESRRVTSIRTLVIAEQNLSASVTGSSSEALYCLRQLAIIINRAAGVERVWSDFEPHIELTSYMTSTVVDLGASMKQMLAPPVRDFLDNAVGGDEGFGAKMGGFPTAVRTDDQSLVVIPAVKRIEFTIGILDSVSGRFESCAVELLTHTTTDQNRGRIKIVTELNSADHRDFVERLVRAIELSS